MKILFIVPRYHTNQINWVRSLIENGNEVNMLVQYKGKTENYIYLEPSLVSESYFSKIKRNKIEQSKLPDNLKVNRSMSVFTPSIFKLFITIKNYKPDFVILRDRTKLSLYSHLICRMLRINSILYNQIPYLKSKDKFIFKRILNYLFFPKYRMTPVINLLDKNIELKSQYEFYIPFSEVNKPGVNKFYFKNNRINILSCGKFYERKNHIMLIRIIKKLKEKYNVHLTIVGEVSNETNIEYLNRVQALIKTLDLNDEVSIKVNVPHREMSELYSENDIFVLQSTQEQAAVSHLEAMSYGLLAISSDTNGTASYIENEVTGFIFKDNSEEDLYNKLDYLCMNRDVIEVFGFNAAEHVNNKFSLKPIYYEFTNMFETIKKSR